MTTYTFGEDAVSILPISELLGYATVDATDLAEYCGCEEEDCEDCWKDVSLITVADLLDLKRDDDHYGDVVESLQVNGFLAPIGVHPTERKLTDGHHRLAAALDLGFRFVPVRSQNGCSRDSGGWSLGEDVPTENLRLYA
jgi:hypothetical protein